MSRRDALWLVVQEPETSRVVAMRGDRLTVGRDLRCDVVIDDAKVSRLHAEITRDPHGRYRFADLSSHNGTVVDGRQLVGALLLEGGETVHLGRTRLEIRLVRPTEDT